MTATARAPARRRPSRATNARSADGLAKVATSKAGGGAADRRPAASATPGRRRRRTPRAASSSRSSSRPPSACGKRMRVPGAQRRRSAATSPSWRWSSPAGRDRATRRPSRRERARRLGADGGDGGRASGTRVRRRVGARAREPHRRRAGEDHPVVVVGARASARSSALQRAAARAAIVG